MRLIVKSLSCLTVIILTAFFQNTSSAHSKEVSTSTVWLSFDNTVNEKEVSIFVYQEIGLRRTDHLNEVSFDSNEGRNFIVSLTFGDTVSEKETPIFVHQEIGPRRTDHLNEVSFDSNEGRNFIVSLTFGDTVSEKETPIFVHQEISPRGTDYLNEGSSPTVWLNFDNTVNKKEVPVLTHQKIDPKKSDQCNGVLPDSTKVDNCINGVTSFYSPISITTINKYRHWIGNFFVLTGDDKAKWRIQEALSVTGFNKASCIPSSFANAKVEIHNERKWKT